MPRHRLDAQDFLHTDPEDDMGAVDYEFDGPRERPGAIVMALVLVAAGALLYAVWWLIGDLVGMFGRTP